MNGRWMLVTLATVLSPVGSVRGAGQPLWGAGRPQARLIGPKLSGPVRDIVQTTLNGYLADAFGWTVPATDRAEAPGLYLLIGDEKNNPAIAELVGKGLKVDRADLGPEGFRILSHEAGERRFVIVTANTPVGLKHGCQELVYFRTTATGDGAAVDWPLDVKMKPAFAYRGVYILPCWSAYDSLASWKRVLKFHSELTLNRNWFWLAGFPLLEQYGGQYAKTDLADASNVTGLVNLCQSEGMKFYIGGGWYTWHHEQHAGGSIERGIQYYLDMLKLLPDTEGIYIEPAGEGSDTNEKTWRERTEAFKRMAETIWRDRPEFEFAIAIGQFNAKAYRQMMHEIDAKRIYWWWCWGDPIRDKALGEHPLVLRWYTIVRMSEYHGGSDAPRPSETALTGYATSYDPGQGYGNPWNGWGKMGVDKPRDVHPYTMPFFSHQYRFRERCWDVNLTEDQFAARLSRRLFDADMPPESIGQYLKLAEFCPKPREADAQVVDAIDKFVSAHASQGTPRNRDTLQRMREALDGMRAERAKPSPKK